MKNGSMSKFQGFLRYGAQNREHSQGTDITARHDDEALQCVISSTECAEDTLRRVNMKADLKTDHMA